MKYHGIEFKDNFNLNDLNFSNVIDGLNKYFAEAETQRVLQPFIEVKSKSDKIIFYRFDSEMYLDKLIAWLRTKHGIFYYPGMESKYAKAEKMIPPFSERMKNDGALNTVETGITEPERIFIDGVPFEKGEYLKLRHSKSIMNDFDLVLNLKRKGLAIAEELLPKSINGYPVRYIFELTPADFGYEDSFDVFTCVSILSNRTRKSTAFSERRSYSLVFAKGYDGSVDKGFYNYLETDFRMIFERLLHAACRSANEYWRAENEKRRVLEKL